MPSENDKNVDQADGPETPASPTPEAVYTPPTESSTPGVAGPPHYVAPAASTSIIGKRRLGTGAIIGISAAGLALIAGVFGGGIALGVSVAHHGPANNRVDVGQANGARGGQQGQGNLGQGGMGQGGFGPDRDGDNRGPMSGNMQRPQGGFGKNGPQGAPGSPVAPGAPGSGTPTTVPAPTQ